MGFRMDKQWGGGKGSLHTKQFRVETQTISRIKANKPASMELLERPCSSRTMGDRKTISCPLCANYQVGVPMLFWAEAGQNVYGSLGAALLPSGGGLLQLLRKRKDLEDTRELSGPRGRNGRELPRQHKPAGKLQKGTRNGEN